MSTFDSLEFTEVEVPPVLAAQVSGQSVPDPAAIGKAMGVTFGQLMGFVGQHKLCPAGPPRCIYTAHSPKGLTFTVAMPIAKAPAKLVKAGPGSIQSIPGAKALRFTHHGAYANLRKTYGQIGEFLKTKGLMKTDADWARYMPMWEEYLNDPQTTPGANLLTYIYLPKT